MEYNRRIIYNEKNQHFKLDIIPYLILLIILPILLFSLNIIGIDYIFKKVHDNTDSILMDIIALIIINILVVFILWLNLMKIKGRAQFKIFEDGFIPPRIPKNRRRPKEKHFISVNEIEKLELVLYRQDPYWGNHVSVTLKEGSQFDVLESHVDRKGLEELMKFKEVHNIKGD